MGEANLAPVGPDDHVIGTSDPKLTLIEYGDFGCQVCNAAKLPIESLLERHPELRFVWRHLPDPELHPGADLAAEQLLGDLHERVAGELPAAREKKRVRLPEPPVPSRG